MTAFSRADFRLRAMTECDLEQVLSWRNQSRVRRFMFTDHVISPEEHRDWFARSRERAQDEHLIFEYRGLPAGVVSFTQLSHEHQRADWGFYLGAEDLPRGTGRCLGFCALEYAFDDLELRKLRGEVLAFNERSLALFSYLGFREEGRFVAELWRGDTHHDVIRFALFRDNWGLHRETVCLQLFNAGAG